MTDPTRAAYESALHKLMNYPNGLQSAGRMMITCTASRTPHRMLPLPHARYMQKPAKKISCAAGNLFRGHGWKKV